MILAYRNALAIMILGFTLHWLSGSLKEKAMNLFIATPVYLQAVLSTLVVFIIYQSVSSSLQPFIYFRF
jgi:alginate O-acetyltransferase complex protein AlgI